MQLILTVSLVVAIMVSCVLLVYSLGRGNGASPVPPGGRSRGRGGWLLRLRSGRSKTVRDKSRQEEVGSFSFPGVFGTERARPKVEGGIASKWPMSTVYRKMGSKQKMAGLAFIITSVVLLGLSVPFNSIVLEVDSVVSFAVAAILFLKDNKSRVHSNVLSAIVLSLGGTIAKLSNRAGSDFYYSPFGREMSEIAVVDSVESPPGTSGTPYKILPPGIGLATLFERETAGNPITMESLKYLLPSVIKENFGLAESAEVIPHFGGVEVLLRNPAVFCSCQNEVSRQSGVVGCTISSFLAVLYTYVSAGPMRLDRCMTNIDSKTWRISMNLLPVSNQNK